MKSYRLNRLFNAKSNRCFDVAVDHGFFNERGFLQGIENLEQCVKTLAAAAPLGRWTVRKIWPRRWQSPGVSGDRR